MAVQGNLFNPTTIERFFEDVKISAKQKQSAKEWLKMLESEKLKKETGHYIDFAVFILRDILGYPIKTTEGMSHEEGNVEFVFSNNEDKQVLCIEAKGTSTKDLFAPQHRIKKEHETPIKQTWDYMGSLGLDYGICTNYKDFVLITKQFGYSKFYFFDFTSIKKNEEKLKEFIGIFSKERIIDKGFVEKLHQESIIEEREFTKEFYKLFHETRLMMIKAFQEKEGVTSDEAIHYTQLYLNRLIFTFFAEDNDFLEDKLFTKRVSEVLNSTLISEHSKLVSDEILGLFKAMDKGSDRLGVFGFNGELFEEYIPPKIYFSDLRDSKFFADVKQHSKLKIKPNEAIQKIIKKYRNELNPIIVNLLNMDSFDFTSEVNVNILGHIFEQSISDLEELKEKGISKRKKEGVYYTPEYITDYICRCTLIPYLSKSGVSTIHELIQEYKNSIEELEKKFADIKILDPACGSGAFLIKTIDILLEIHKEIQIVKETKGGYHTAEQFQLTKWNEESNARMIIENNIYGVDINPESVEITKLGLFLKIASKNRKLIGLSKNIKVGNSLIDDKSIDSRAFCWEDEFPEVMKFGKFDIVIGNPPYVRIENVGKNEKDYFYSKFESAAKRFDLYMLFIERGLGLLKNEGYFSYIVPNKFTKTASGEKIRNLISKNYDIKTFVDFGHLKVFENLTTYSSIITIRKFHTEENISHYVKIKKIMPNLIECVVLNQSRSNYEDNLIKVFKFNQRRLEDSPWQFLSKEISILYEKVKNSSQTKLGDIVKKIFEGLITGDNDTYFLYEPTLKEYKIEEKLVFPVPKGKDVRKYSIYWDQRYVIYPYEKASEEKKEPISLEKYPNAKKYLEKFKQKLENRQSMKRTKKQWYEMVEPRQFFRFEQDKIITPNLARENNFALDFADNSLKKHYFIDHDCYGIILKDKDRDNYLFVLSILNSKLMEFFIKQHSPKYGGEYYKYHTQYLEKIPIKNTSEDEKKTIINYVKSIMTLQKEIDTIIDKFMTRMLSTFKPSKLTKNIEDYFAIDFLHFFNEIKKNSSVTISLKEQDEWQEYFEVKKTDFQNKQKEISNLDDKLNKLIYQMYDLTDDEIEKIKDSLR